MGLEIDTIIMDAINEAGMLHQTYLGSEHLLLAILKNEQLHITKLLKKYGMNYQDIREQIVALNYYYGALPVHSGYSCAVIRILQHCDSAAAIIMEMLREDSLASTLLQRYAIPIEKLTH